MHDFNQTGTSNERGADLMGAEELEMPYVLKKEDFWADMDEWDATDAEKIAWLIELAHIIKGFVDWGLGQDTVQMMMAKNFVDNHANDNILCTADSVNMLEHKGNSTDHQIVPIEAGKEGNHE